MISECPHCKQILRFSEIQKQKLSSALDKLPSGKTLKMGCPKCKVSIELQSDGSTASSTDKPTPNNTTHPSIEPPKPQELGWLTSGEADEEKIVDNIPTALVLIPEGDDKITISSYLEEYKYQIYSPETVDEAINSMRFRDFHIVVYHSEYDSAALDDQEFHKFMMQMSMSKRRYIYYILLGPEFKTLYDLEALTFSANLVINTKEAQYLTTILMKGLAECDALFVPYSDILKKHGKN